MDTNCITHRRARSPGLRGEKVLLVVCGVGGVGRWRGGHGYEESYGNQTFFANRVGEIQRSPSVEDRMWIPGQLNVADLLTRGATPEDLEDGCEWFQGSCKGLSKNWQETPKEAAAYAKGR